jgi:MYXO-CTERM domain-containing protein
MFRRARLWVLGTVLLSGACSGSISCSSCGGTPLDPIPGGFDPAARIPRAAQVRLSRTGLDFLETRFSDLVNAYARQSCGDVTDPPCPTGFGTTCNAGGVCVDGGGVPQPVLGFEVEYTTSGSAVVCRDPEADPSRRDCFAWLRLEGLGLTPEGPNKVRANVVAKVITTDIPIRYANSILDLDCIVNLDSARSGSPLQDLELVIELVAWSPPSGAGGGQLQVNVLEVNANIPDEDLTVRGDPIQGGTGDAIACGGLNALGSLKAALLDQLTDQLGDILQEQLDEVLGWRCGRPADRACPSGATCNADGFCAVAGRVVPNELGLEGRADFASLLGGLSGGGQGQTDVAFLVGGNTTADAVGVNLSTLGGAELVTLDPACALELPSPRLRPSYAPPPPLPTDGRADLDWDGTPETPYMVAAGLSEAFLDQVMWSLYGSGVFCQTLSADDVDLLNTGSLGLVLPSLDLLTHADKYPWAVYPVALRLTPTAEPVISIGSGELTPGGATPTLVEPLIRIVLDDVRLDLTALIEERWVHLLTVQADLTLDLGATVNPSNEVELVLGDLGQAVTDVRVSQAELLAETPQELADAIPALIQLALPQLTGNLPSIPLPGPEALGGFELRVLGVRGVPGATPSVFPNLAVYADLDFIPALAGNLLVQAETEAHVAAVRFAGGARSGPGPDDLPPLAAARAAGGAEPTEVVLALGGAALPGQALEHQVRIDGGLWSPFFTAAQVSLPRAAFNVPGRHRVEVRARAQGEYRTLDPTPVVLDVVVDPEPPRAEVRVASDGLSLRVRAVDRVSRQRLGYTVELDGVARPATVDDAGRLAVPELADPAVAVAVVVADEQGLSTRVVVREAGAWQVPAVEAEAGGCRCAAPGAGASWAGLGLGLVALGALRRRRR